MPRKSLESWVISLLELCAARSQYVLGFRSVFRGCREKGPGCQADRGITEPFDKLVIQTIYPVNYIYYH